MKHLPFSLFGLIPVIASVVTFAHAAETVDLLKGGVLDGFREVELWRGVGNKWSSADRKVKRNSIRSG
jgi:hypothetical protein